MFSESETMLGVEMKLLVVFLLALLGCSLAEGRIVSDCELRDELVKAINGQAGLNEVNLVPKLVCHAQWASGLNTSAIYVDQSPEHEGQDSVHRDRRDAEELPPIIRHTSTTPPPTEPTQSNQYTAKPRSVNEPKPSPDSPPTKYTPSTEANPITHPMISSRPRGRRSSQHHHELGTLYGIFQLSNRLVCTDGTTPSDNFCGQTCSKLIDDDISDDVACVLKIIANVLLNGFESGEALLKMFKLILDPHCSNAQTSQYFSTC